MNRFAILAAAAMAMTIVAACCGGHDLDGLTLLRTAADAGLYVRADGDLLVMTGPASAEPTAKTLLARKPEVMAAIASRPAPPQIEDGCSEHEVAQVSVAERWIEVGEQDLRPGCCACCGGPAQPETLVCLWCSQLSPEREAELTVAPPCVRCGGKPYSSLTEGWLCQTCWQGAS